MPDNKTSVAGIYPTRESVERATDNLVKSGFPSSDISVLLPENLGSKAIGTDNATKAQEGAVSWRSARRDRRPVGRNRSPGDPWRCAFNCLQSPSSLPSLAWASAGPLAAPPGH